MIRNMDKLRSENWPLFKSYALTDAEICVRYIEQVINQYKAITGKSKVPITLTSIGIDQLLQSWTNLDIDTNTILGKENIKTSYFNKKKGEFKNEVQLLLIGWLTDLYISIKVSCFDSNKRTDSFKRSSNRTSSFLYHLQQRSFDSARVNAIIHSFS
jgi:hypothetical protein